MPETVDIDQVAADLAQPFDPAEVKWKPTTVKDNRALVICFVDARVIQDRLDDVLGVMGWQDSYECLPDGAVVCRLRIRVGGEWITKEDVGGMSEQPDEGDRRKAAFSDALKRAAVKYGIGRYLYRLKPQWMDYDPQKRQVVGTPKLPTAAQGQQKPRPAAEAVQPKAEQPKAFDVAAFIANADARSVADGLAAQPGELRAEFEAAMKKDAGLATADAAREWVRGWGEGRKLRLPATDEMHAELSAQTRRAGLVWRDVCDAIGEPVATFKSDDLCRGQWAEALAKVKEMPDAPAKGTKRAG